MNQPVLLFLSLCLSINSIAQNNIRNYVKQSAIRIESIDPDSTNYADLEAIGQAIGESKMVMLGEQDHGDAPTFLAKNRLIKYLHEKKGFNVLAFESDFFALNEGWNGISKTEEEIKGFLSRNIYPIWTSCDACKVLFAKVIPNSYQTQHPIIVSGFDNQMYLQYSGKALARKLDSVLRELNLPITATQDYQSDIIALVDSMTRLSFLRKDNLFYDKVIDKLEMLKQAISQKIEGSNFWTLVVDNLIQTAIEMRYMNSDHYKSFNARDIQMAKNLSWLSKVRFPNEKIIVWAHNYHISKYGGHFSDNFLNLANTMGTEFTKDSLQSGNTYILGFTSRQGKAGRISSQTFTVQSPSKNGIESWFDDSIDYGFVDFRKYNLMNPDTVTEFELKGSVKGVHRNHKAQWTRIFDGVFYIRNMYPCKVAD